MDRQKEGLYKGDYIMKKRCTNSACRRVFTAGTECPYCGKQYPRIKVQVRTEARSKNYQVVLTDIGLSKIYLIKTVREDLQIGLKAAKDLVDSCPCVILENIPYDEAIALNKRLQAAGAASKVERMVRN